jgi:hypothetical protein
MQRSISLQPWNWNTATWSRFFDCIALRNLIQTILLPLDDTHYTNSVNLLTTNTDDNKGNKKEDVGGNNYTP